MSNLGGYQTIVTIAKKLGGPRNFVITLIGGGLVLGVGGAIGGKKAIKWISEKIKSKEIQYLENGRIFVVSVESKGENGLHFKLGDKYKILSRDKDAIMIEILGNDNNPFVVSVELLKQISDYNWED